MMKLQRMAALLCALSATPVLADSIDINLHDKAIRGTYTMQLQNTKGLSGEAGVLYTEDRFNNSDTLLHVGLLVSGENWSKSGTFDISMGARMVYASLDPFDMAAVAFGGRLRFSPVPRLGIGGHAYFSPEITSFLDSESFQEVGVRVDYQLLPQAFVYVGYRNIKVDFGAPGNWEEMDDEAHVGFKMTF
ncbi:MAG: YfaZ family outer membrane protein [Pseudomonadota bacterium]